MNIVSIVELPLKSLGDWRQPPGDHRLTGAVRIFTLPDTLKWDESFIDAVDDLCN